MHAWMTIRFRLPAVAVLLLSLAWAAPALPAETKETLHGKQWRLKYGGGTEAIKPGRRLLITVGERVIFLDDPKIGNKGISILTSDVTDIYYDTRAWNATVPLLKATSKWAEEIHDPVDGEAALLMTLFGLAAAPATLPIRGKHHFIHIEWMEGDLRRRVTLRTSKSNRDAILAELQLVTGQEWIHVPRERKRIRQKRQALHADLKMPRDEMIRIWLGRTTRAGAAILEPGLYRLVFLERHPASGKLYFFQKRFDVDHLAASVPVEVESHPGQVTYTRCEFQQQAYGIPRISRVRTPARTLRVAGPASARE